MESDKEVTVCFPFYARNTERGEGGGEGRF